MALTKQNVSEGFRIFGRGGGFNIDCTHKWMYLSVSILCVMLCSSVWPYRQSDRQDGPYRRNRSDRAGRSVSEQNNSDKSGC